MAKHNAVVDRVFGGWRAHCLTTDCPWKGEVHRPNQGERADIALARAEVEALEEAEAHDEAMDELEAAADQRRTDAIAYERKQWVK